jgi:hypothetical protein
MYECLPIILHLMSIEQRLEEIGIFVLVEGRQVLLTLQKDTVDAAQVIIILGCYLELLDDLSQFI